ncbi:HNH endonuclease [Pseudomonas palleroniana]
MTLFSHTWHHHQDTGRMQLVPEAFHNGARHIGWESMSKGQ